MARGDGRGRGRARRARSARRACTVTLWEWIPAGDFVVEVGFYVDNLTAVLLIVVTTIGMLVHVYSIGYMRHDPGYWRFFAYLNLFMVSMLLLVLADSWLVLFVAWELVGLSSYLLIGFWYRKRSAAEASKKAFITNRVGDVGLRARDHGDLREHRATLNIRESIELLTSARHSASWRCVVASRSRSRSGSSRS